MFYCERCKILCEDKFCSFCGNKNVRPAQNDDFCFLFECDAGFGEMLESVFKEEGIACALVPSGSGIRTAVALNLENYKVYVPYERYDAAIEIYESFLGDSPEDLKDNLLNNIDKWFITSAFLERRMRKLLKLLDGESLFDACKQLVLQSSKITDGGLIGTCQKGGHFIFVYADTVILSFNSQTYEILGINKR